MRTGSPASLANYWELIASGDIPNQAPGCTLKDLYPKGWVPHIYVVFHFGLAPQNSVAVLQGLEALGGKVQVTRESACVHSPDTFAVNNLKESNMSCVFSSRG